MKLILKLFAFINLCIYSVLNLLIQDVVACVGCGVKLNYITK